MDRRTTHSLKLALSQGRRQGTRLLAFVAGLLPSSLLRSRGVPQSWRSPRALTSRCPPSAPPRPPPFLWLTRLHSLRAGQFLSPPPSPHYAGAWPLLPRAKRLSPASSRAPAPSETTLRASHRSVRRRGGTVCFSSILTTAKRVLSLSSAAACRRSDSGLCNYRAEEGHEGQPQRWQMGLQSALGCTSTECSGAIRILSSFALSCAL